MHEEEVDLTLDRRLDRQFVRVDGGAHAGDGAGALDLEPVGRPLIVRKGGKAERGVEKSEDMF
jgi:hypothetical protein